MTVVELLTDPVLIGILAVLLLFVFFGYLLMSAYRPWASRRVS